MAADKAFGERSDDDEMDLINAEFESMVSGLHLDQSSPRTYLDELDALEREEAEELHRVNNILKSPVGSRRKFFDAIKSWWLREGDNRDDGAQL